MSLESGSLVAFSGRAGRPLIADRQYPGRMPRSPLVLGALTLRRRRASGFPWAEAISRSEVVAEVGRYSLLNVFLGRGQRVRLPDGRQWRVKSIGWHRYVCPVVLGPEGRGLAISAPGHDSYAIDAPGRGLTMQPAESRPGRPRKWTLRERDEEIGRLERNPFLAELYVPAPLSAVLLGFVLAAFGILGEKDLVANTTSWA